MFNSLVKSQVKFIMIVKIVTNFDIKITKGRTGYNIRIISDFGFLCG